LRPRPASDTRILSRHLSSPTEPLFCLYWVVPQQTVFNLNLIKFILSYTGFVKVVAVHSPSLHFVQGNNKLPYEVPPLPFLRSPYYVSLVGYIIPTTSTTWDCDLTFILKETLKLQDAIVSPGGERFFTFLLWITLVGVPTSSEQPCVARSRYLNLYRWPKF